MFSSESKVPLECAPWYLGFRGLYVRWFCGYDCSRPQLPCDQNLYFFVVDKARGDIYNQLNKVAIFSTDYLSHLSCQSGHAKAITSK